MARSLLALSTIACSVSYRSVILMHPSEPPVPPFCPALLTLGTGPNWHDLSTINKKRHNLYIYHSTLTWNARCPPPVSSPSYNPR